MASRNRGCSCTSATVPIVLLAGGLLGWRSHGMGGLLIGIALAIPALGLILFLAARLLGGHRD